MTTYTIKFINNFPIHNENNDCLFEALSMFSYLIESKDISKLIDKFSKLLKYKSEDGVLYISILEEICNLSNNLNILNPLNFNKTIHSHAKTFRSIDSFSELNLSPPSYKFNSVVDSSFLTDETVLFHSSNDGGVHIQLINLNHHYFVLVIAGNCIYVLDSIRKNVIYNLENAHIILHFVYYTNETIISKLESMTYDKIICELKILSIEELANKLYSCENTNQENEFLSLYNQNLIEKC
jgi:hypothetical protein